MAKGQMYPSMLDEPLFQKPGSTYMLVGDDVLRWDAPKYGTPTEPGFYWAKRRGRDEWEVVRFNVYRPNSGVDYDVMVVCDDDRYQPHQFDWGARIEMPR